MGSPTLRIVRARTLLIAAAVAVPVACFGESASAAQYSWNKTADLAPWETADNWLVGAVAPATPPGAGDDIITPTQFSSRTSIYQTVTTVNSWDFDSSSSWGTLMRTDGSSMTISGALTKAGTGALTFGSQGPNGSGEHYGTLTAGSFSISAGTVNFGNTGNTQYLRSLTLGSANLTGGTVNLFVASSTINQSGALRATVTGNLAMSGSSTLYVAPTTTNRYQNLSVGSLTSTDTTPVIRANAFSGAGSFSYAGLYLNNPANTTSSFAGRFQGSSGGYLSIVKNGDGTQIFTGDLNNNRGSTTVNAGALLLNNASGSGTGIGPVIVNAGGTLGGEGRIAPDNITQVTDPGVTVAGTLSPGASAGAIGDFEVNLSLTGGNLTMQSGGSLLMDLGTPGATIAAPGAGDLLLLTGMSAGRVSFDNNTIAVQGGGVGWYKLLDTDGGGATWSGLTLSGQTITGGLSLAGGYGGTLLMGDGINGDVGDIYLNVTAVPEPAALSLLALGGLALVRRRRERQA